MQRPDTPADSAQALKKELSRLRAKLTETSDRDIRAALQMRIEQIQSEMPKDGPTVAKADPAAEEKELARLRVKLQHTTDRDIQAALQMKIDQLKASIAEESNKPVVAADAAEEEEPEIQPSSPEQIVIADGLIRQARVEKMRNNVARSTELIKQASEAAPGSAAVLEALGDDLMERRLVKQAVAAYKRASRLEPKNIAIEEKFAMAALQLQSFGSLDDQMRSMSDPLLLSREDTLARVPYAAVLSAFFPGVGHLVLGQTTKGFAILAGWVICIVWAITQRNDLEMIFRTVGGQSRHPNYVVLLPIAIGAVIYVSTLMSFKGMSRTTVKKDFHRPPPPTEGGNLPFE